MAEPQQRPFVVLSGEGVAARGSSGPVDVKATTFLTGGALGLWEHAEGPNEGAPLHAHPAAEAFYILAGSYEFLVEGEWFDAPAGSFVFVPAGAVHGFRAGSNGGRKLGLFVPGGNEGLFVDWQMLVERGELNPDAMKALRERFGVESHGPLPDRIVDEQIRQDSTP